MTASVVVSGLLVGFSNNLIDANAAIDPNTKIIGDGDYSNSIRLILDGEVVVSKDNKYITNLFYFFIYQIS